MKNTVIKVVTFGVFDMFHFGHLRLFEKIKKTFGENCFLIVCVQSSENIKKYKPESKIFYSTEDRCHLIKAIKYVDEVKIYDNIEDDIKKVEFDIWAKGPDQNHCGFINAMKWCDNNHKKYVTIGRTEGICSTYLKNLVNDFNKSNAS